MTLMKKMVKDKSRKKVEERQQESSAEENIQQDKKYSKRKANSRNNETKLKKVKVQMSRSSLLLFCAWISEYLTAV